MKNATPTPPATSKVSSPPVSFFTCAYSHTSPVRPRGRAKKGCKPGQLTTGYEIDDPNDDSKAAIKAELKDDPDCKPEMKVFFQPGMGLPVHGAGQAWERPLAGRMCGFDGLEAFVGGLESLEALDDMPLIQMRGIRARVKAERGREAEMAEPAKVKVEVDEFGRPVQYGAGEQVEFSGVQGQEGAGGYEAGYEGEVGMRVDAGQMEDGGRILSEGLERVFEEQIAQPEECL